MATRRARAATALRNAGTPEGDARVTAVLVVTAVFIMAFLTAPGAMVLLPNTVEQADGTTPFWTTAEAASKSGVTINYGPILAHSAIFALLVSLMFMWIPRSRGRRARPFTVFLFFTLVFCVALLLEPGSVLLLPPVVTQRDGDKPVWTPDRAYSTAGVTVNTWPYLLHAAVLCAATAGVYVGFGKMLDASNTAPRSNPLYRLRDEEKGIVGGVPPPPPRGGQSLYGRRRVRRHIFSSWAKQ